MDMMNNCLTHGNKSCNSIISSIRTKNVKKNPTKTVIDFALRNTWLNIDGVKILEKLVFLLQAKEERAIRA